jgi:HAD superfamily hydrolase (TIGR01549 family)
VTGTGGRLHGVVFDFDGVILESLEIKTNAFVVLFERWPEHQEAVKRLHLANTGISRYDKFERIYREILELPLPAEELERLGEEFGRLVRDQLLQCDFVPGVKELIERLTPEYQLFVASGTPEDEMREIVRDRGLERFFAAVCGSPSSKAEILRRIAAEEGVLPGELLFIGDAVADFEGAREAGVPFVARLTPGSQEAFPADEIVAGVRDMCELDSRWEQIERAACAWGK